MNYYRLCYMSQAKKPDHLVRQDLMDIITEAVQFNSRHNIYGVLYYGNGYFFQCLEGNKDQVEYLYYSLILKDRRHQNAVLLLSEDIDTLRFSTWHMKFAPYHQEIMCFMKQHNKTQFDPYILSDDNLEQFLSILIRI